MMKKTRNLRVSEFADIYSGGTPSTADSSYWGGDIAWITPKDMSGHTGVYIRNGERFINELGLRESSACMIPANTVILSSRAPVGYVAIAENPLTTSQGCKNLKCKEGVADPVYVYYLLKNNTAKLKAHATGATYGELSASRLQGMSFNLPEDVGIQREIASFLLAYDNLIANNYRRIQLLEKAAKLIYEEWFIRLRFPGYENTEMVDGVPVGWNLAHLSKIFSTQYGYTETASNKPVGPKFLRGTDINKTSFIDWSTVPFCPEDKLDFDRYSLQVGDIVVIRMADPGKVAIVETAQKAVFASYLVRLKQKPGIGIPPLYLFYTLAGGDYSRFISRASGGTTRKSANARLLLSFEILLPPKNLAELFVKTVNPMRQQIQTLLRQNGALRQARDSLLPRLISGDLLNHLNGLRDNQN